ncbi:hypothetical protein [Paenibacillus sp. MMS18-CY102]|uniref:hypothetical protein n=1 Tax=Paenibacillus sp. MMS18-CY102 TaxID=2682849 RepID=UPI0013662265|nr:hypothetical protein [Paenibacillus sp. MMS18-CY102]MWC27122.1 hypothetical protein [Paenibacillus sp. MMS18-CY102]
MKKKVIFAIVGALCLVGGSYVIYDNVYKPDNVIVSSAQYAFDVNNKEMLVGWAENVFVGTVNKKQKEDKDQVSPYSTYTVTVHENIKGNLEGDIEISHRVAYDNEKKALFKFEGADYLAENKKYLFVSRTDTKTGQITVVPIYGTILINDEENERKIKAEFKEAKLNEKDPFKKNNE